MGSALPKASKAPKLTEVARERYAEAGWHVTAAGRVGTGQVVGPCHRCGRSDVRYGPHGHPLCKECRARSTATMEEAR